MPDNTIRGKMDVGPPKLRQRSTSAPTIFRGSLLLNSTQAGYFETFYRSTLKHGSLPFTWVHPRTRNSADMNFVGQPEMIYVGGGWWKVNLVLEILV